MVHSEGTSGTFKDAFIDFVAGSLGAIALVYVGQPMDTIKVKMQTFPHQYRGMWHCVQETWVKEGIVRGFYAGTVPSLVANIAENSVLFSGYGACQKAIGKLTSKKPDKLTLWENGAAGSLAAFFSSFVLCPTELVKCRLQALRETKTSQGKALEHIGPLQLTRQIIQERGPAGLFQGLASTLTREVPGYMFLFAGYEGARDFMTPKGGSKEDIGPLKTMLAGGWGGVVFWTIMFPIDVVKSRVQVSGCSSSMVSTICGIVQQKGITTLYRGLTPCLMRTMPACAVMFVVYEYSKMAIHAYLD